MDIITHEFDSIVVLEISGNIIGPPLSIRLSKSIYELVEKGKNKIVLDLSKVNWMNSAGIGLIVGGLTTIRNSGGELKLACPSGKVKKLFDLTNLSSIVGTYNTVQQAKDSFNQR
jgi:anti-sigma B factor antagonist